MVVLEGDAAGQIVLRGAGAGEGPTASAVMSDIIDIARGARVSTFGQPAATLATSRARRRRHARALLPAHGACSTNRARSPRSRPCSATRASPSTGCASTGTRASGAPVLIVTHRTSRHALDAAIEGMAGTGVLASDPVALRIEEV